MINYFKKLLGYSSRGEEILRLAQTNFEICTLLDKIRSQGATDADIVWWWNMPNTQWEKIIEEDNIAKLAVIQAHIEDGMDEKEAFRRIKKTFPLFDSYKPGLLYTDKDSPLPYELKERVNKYFSGLSNSEIEIQQKFIESFSSMNAYIRQLIQEKSL